MNKAAMIKQLCSVLDQRTTNARDVLNLVNFILDAGEFLTELRGQANNGNMKTALQVQKLILASKGSDHLEAPFMVLADTANSGAILAGQHAEALNLVNGMSTELEQLVDENNS